MTNLPANPDEAAAPSTGARQTPAADSTGAPQADVLLPHGAGGQAGQELRRQAEEQARAQAAQRPEPLEALFRENARQALHELRVYQSKLEMRNEQLRQTQTDLEAAWVRYFDLYDLAPVGYCTISEQGLILEANLTAATLLGVARGGLVKQPLSRFVLTGDQALYYRHRTTLFETGEPQVCELRMVKKDGTSSWARLEATVVQDAAGAPVCRAVLTDITARTQTEAALRQAHDELDQRVAGRTEELRRANEELRADITARTQTEAALATRIREIEAVRAVTAEITQELDLPTLLARISRHAAKLVEAASSIVRLWDETAGLLIPIAWFGHGEWIRDERRRLGEGISGTVAAHRVGLIINDYQASPYAMPAILAQTTITAVLAEPLLYCERLLGVLAVDRHAGARPFTEQDRQLLTLFAAQAAIAIENARLFTDLTQSLHELRQEVARRQQAEDDLRTSRALLQAVVEGTPDTVFVKDLQGRFLLFNPAAEQFTGKRAAETLGHDAHFLFPPAEAAAVMVRDRAVLEGGKTITIEDVVTDAAGARHTFLSTRGPLVDAAGLPIGLFGIDRDITARKQAEATLLSRTRQLEAVREVSAEITRELDLDRLLALITKWVTALLGVPTSTVRLWEEATGLLRLRSWTGEAGTGPVAIPLRVGEGVAGAAAQRRTGLLVNDFRTSPYATPALLEGPHTAVLAEPLLLCHDRLVGVLSVNNGTTGRLFTVDDQALLRLFADQAAIAIENARLHTAAVHKGEELGALLRATHAVMTGLNLQQTLEAIASEAARIARCDHVKLLLVDRDAQVLRIGVLRGLTAPEGFPLPIGTGLSGTVAQTGHLLYIADTQNDPRSVLAAFDRSVGLRTYLGLPITIRDEVVGVLTFNTREPRQYTSEELAYFTAFADHAALAIENARLYTEATQSLQALHQAQETLVQTEKRRALGQLAGGIAHDLNNKLMVILGQAELLRRTVPHPGLVQELAPIEEAATASAAVVRQLLDFGRQHASVPHTSIALASVVQGALALTQGQWKDAAERQGASLTIHTALADLPPVLGQAAELREALVQMIGNAVEAMPTGGTLTIAGRVVERGTGGTTAEQWTGNLVESSPPRHQSAAPPVHADGGFVELTVTDTGVGIPAEIQPRIFDPFFTTKGVQRTGLGLAVVYGTVQRHGGAITVASTPGQGTTVTLRLPVAPAAAPGPAATRPGGTPCRLLVIDDEPQVRETLASLLRVAGHTVTEAASGPAGLALLDTLPVDCVLTDLGMPEMTGWEVAKAVNASWPTLPVLLLTGWGDQAADVPPGHRVARVLSKPIHLEQLLAVIAEVTGGP